MNFSRSLHRWPHRGSALLTVIFFITIMALLTASLLKYSANEKRANERQRLILRSRNMSENVVIYASEQITNKLYKLRTSQPMAFLGSNAVTLPPDDVLTTRFSDPDDVEVRAGLTSTSGLEYIDPADPANATNPNAGLQVSRSRVPIIGKSTMRHPQIGEVSTHALQELEIAMMPLFQFAVFYNMDMEFGPGPNMTISGPVHTNGDLIARIQTGFANTLRFTDRVTSAKGFYANTAHRGSTYMAGGNSDDGPGGTGPLVFRSPTDPINGGTDIKSSAGVWRDHKWTSSNTPNSVTETATTLSQFRSFATATYGGNLRTSVHGVTKLALPAIGDYDESTPEGRKNGRQIIDPPLSTDAGGLLGTKFGRNAGLYIVVNPDDEQRIGRLPNGDTVTMRGRSYRAFLNTVDGSSHTIEEVVLPGQPSYGSLNAHVNNLPNAYRVDTSVGHNQVLRIPQSASATVDLAGTGYAWNGSLPDFDASPTPAEVLTQDAYFYDIRRAFNNTGAPFNRSNGNRFRPRPIAKIDFDLTRFKMAIERSVFGNASATIYNPSIPNSTNWSSNILNSGASPSSHGLGLATGSNTNFSIFPSENHITHIQRRPDGTFFPESLTINSLSKTGTADPVAYIGRLIIEETSSPTYSSWAAPIYSGNASSYTYTPSSSSITAVRITQQLLGTTTQLDTQIIPIVAIGTPPANTVSACLTNDRTIVPTTLLGVASPSLSTYPITTEMRVYVDGIDDTVNWTFSHSLVSGTIPVANRTLGGAPFANRLTVTALNSNTATLSITASKSGFSNITRQFSLQKQSSIGGLLTALLGASTTYAITTTAGPAPDPFRIYYAPEDPADIPVAVSANGFVNSGSSPWFDGITIYVHSVDAEDLSVTGTGNSAIRNRVDSGVRLWNGRGPLISLPGATHPGRTGLSFVTNDAIYIIGHYNADGSTNSNLNSVGVGGYSGRYPESSSEMLTAVMGDAINIFSQPVFTSSGGNYRQSSGWSDSMSAHRRDDSANYSTSWFSSNPSNSNTQDGLNDAVRPALMPNLTVSSNDTGPGPKANPPSTRTSKFAPSETEISACLLTGIVPTPRHTESGSKQTSGGVHNFPRLSENWAGTVALYIRGSLVAMFESQVATEPWSIRWYQGAIRNWGLHESLRDANHDVPLEPIVLGGRRMSYRELSPTEYDDLKTEIEDLPH